MSKLIKWFTHYISLEYYEFGFIDVISGETVCYYIDCYGNKFMKDSRWSLFEIEVKS